MGVVFLGIRGRSAVVTLASVVSLAGCCPPTILTKELPVGRTGEPYEVQFEAECLGGDWWISGDLPPGMSFNNEGLLFGVPRYAGVYFLTVTWEDVYEGNVISSATSAYDLVIVDRDQPVSRDELVAD